MNISPRDILKQYWGFEDFKSSQKIAIQSVLESQDTCVFLPTGGGKSICFQVPALAMPGICIVISPLVALMEDQVENLKTKGIKAQLLKSGMSFKEIDQKLDNCVYGNYKFLYLSPERLQQELVQQRILKMNVNLIAVDEAHCISQWGHDFRPAYKEIHKLKELQPKVPIIALTATATKQVKKDIQEELELHQPKIIEESFKRENIAFLKRYSYDKINELYSSLKSSNSSSIVYVRNRSTCQELSSFLNKKGLKATFYHGGVSTNDKQKRLVSWLTEETPVMVATNAFGMGIDKSNVRLVIHYHLPESLESYYQEAGRAGRDGKAAQAMMLYNDSDKQRLTNQFIKTIPQFETVQVVYKSMMKHFRIAYGEGQETTHDFNFHEFCSKYKLHTILTFNTLNLLDRLSVISLDKSFQKKTRLKFLVSSERLIDFINHHTQFALLIRTLLRTYGGVFEQELNINTQLLQKKTGYNEKEVIAQLEALEKHGLLEADFIKQDLSITLIKPREDQYTLNPLRKYIFQYQENKLGKARSVLEYVEEHYNCLQNFILNYFGEQNHLDCGQCSNCMNKKEKKINKPNNEQGKIIQNFIMTQLAQSDLNSRDIIEKSDFPKEAILETLQLLIEKGQIKLTQKNTYSL
ncbi:RecQ family ATP-dependent DNA helicase [Psychroflexus tropicus]|uniref:RecQ family ATP-dependent DNA helicase n=1 Tax=Psychroflexus tropicus TaxID=197345 RepID=UPI00036A1FD0|nr:ATP-dependent DNA helicase RecQ [Psychroflexus tropicus]